jgi:hypothetical protein
MSNDNARYPVMAETNPNEKNPQQNPQQQPPQPPERQPRASRQTAATVAQPPASQPPPPTGPAYDGKRNLTRAGMEQVHREGGSVLYKGTIIPPGAPLPSEAELAVGDETATAAALEGLRAQREQLDRQERALLAAKGQTADAAGNKGAAAKQK